MLQIQNFINGQFCDARSGAWLSNYEPATGQVYSQLCDSDASDVQDAVDAAIAAFPAWSELPASGRSAIMLRVADGIQERFEEFVVAESQDQGKPEWLCRVMDIPRAISNFRFFATEILHTRSEVHSGNGEGLNYTLRRPIGPVGCISPWNLPLYLFTWKVAPALAAGNTVVAKQSEITPRTASMLAEVCAAVGLPAGVLNIVHGLGDKVGSAIVEHPALKAISFTGSTRVGEYIARTAAPMFKKLSLELGGKNPTLVFADADFDKAVRESVRASFLNQGEICLCGSRILVERSIYDRFRDAFVEQVKAMSVGDPRDPNSRIGALASEAHYRKVLSYIELAQQEGGRILCGGAALQPEGRCSGGWFILPTVVEGLEPVCRTNMEEIFGPVVTLTPFDSEDEAVRLANSTSYGLSAVLFTENLRRAHRVAAALQSGIVWVNCWLVRDLRTPFGGVKNSGVGREGGIESLRFFSETKNVCVEM